LGTGIWNHRASEYSCPAKPRQKRQRKGAEKSGSRGLNGRRDAQRRQTGLHRARERSGRQAGVLSRGGSVYIKHHICCEPAVYVCRQGAARKREVGR
jgi:hypothetical protein